MKKASQKVIEELKNNAKKIEYKEEIAQVAAISAQDIEV
jgi:chaperonin GroEL (HSP60 family)